MRPGQLVLEALAAVRSQRVPSTMVVLLAAVMCLATILTVGRSVSAEREVAARLDAAGSRVLVIADAQNTGIITDTTVTTTAALSVVERAIGLTLPVDVTNGVIGAGGTKVPAWQLVGDPHAAATLTGGRWPQPGEALASGAARTALGLDDGIGWVTAGPAQYPIVGTFTARTPFEKLADGVIIAAPARTNPADLSVIVTRADEARTAQTLVLGLIKPARTNEVTVQSPISLAAIQNQVGADFGNFSRNILYGVLGAGALLIAIVVLADVLIRRKDLGRRRALGATRSVITALVMLRTAIPALIGAALGAAGGYYLTTRWSVAPPPTFAIAIATLATLTAAASSILPAIFAARRDPVAVLRTP